MYKTFQSICIIDLLELRTRFENDAKPKLINHNTDYKRQKIWMEFEILSTLLCRQFDR